MNRVGYFQLGKNGRIGNQLFQIFSTLGYAKKHRLNAYFNKSDIFKYLHNIEYSTDYQFQSSNILSEDKNIKYKEFKAYDDVILTGYLQSYKYFENLDNTHFKFYNNEKFLENYRLDYDCFIHIRRGDYVTVSSLLLSKQYYLDAIDFMKQTYGVESFLIFTDDVDYCRREYSNIENVYITMGSNSDYLDLMMMSKLKYGILSNSSYSWWGAKLNSNNNIIKHIVAPLHWFNKNEIDTDDLLYDNWNKLWNNKYISYF